MSLYLFISPLFLKEKYLAWNKWQITQNTLKINMICYSIYPLLCDRMNKFPVFISSLGSYLHYFEIATFTNLYAYYCLFTISWTLYEWVKILRKKATCYQVFLLFNFFPYVVHQYDLKNINNTSRLCSCQPHSFLSEFLF